MIKTSKILLFFIILFPLFVSGQTYYWIGFTDKDNSSFSLNNPYEYLSARAVQRRIKQNIPIDEMDLPVKKEYINQILDLGAKFVHSSKWLNGITVESGLDGFEENIKNLPFVKEVQITKHSLPNTKSLTDKFYINEQFDDHPAIDSSFYGQSVFQVGQLTGQYLHNQGYYGEGVHVAVLDAGFLKVNELAAFDSLWANHRILGTKDFVDPGSDFYSNHYHGMSVLSTMGGFIQNELIGTAPKASYWLIRSEDVASEFLIEEDNWVAAAEYADSVGADIINSSLGYYMFDDTTMNHSYADMDGKTTRVTKAANIAFSKGMLVFASAGNEGNDYWKYIIAPSDGDGVIGVGAVNKDGVVAPFTSYGPASDGDIKPNVAALGWNTVLQRSKGNIGKASGTSFSSPVLAGMAACLLQANPNSSARQIKDAIEESSHLYNNPDSVQGFGIPDFKLADKILKISQIELVDRNINWFIYPNPFHDQLVIYQHTDSLVADIEFDFLDLKGRVLKNRVMKSKTIIVLNDLEALPTGFLILRARYGNGVSSFKLLKSK